MDGKNSGVDRARIDERLIALNIHVKRSGFGGSYFSQPISSRRMLAAGHSHASTEFANSGSNTVIVSGDHDVGQIV